MSTRKSTLPTEMKTYKKCDQIATKLGFFHFFTFFFFERAEGIYLYECSSFQEFVESLFLWYSNPQNTF